MQKTRQKETATRKKINTWLEKLGWIIDEDDKDCNAYTERPKTKEQKASLDGKEPDFVLYKSGTIEPLAVIEAKRKGENIEDALEQGTDYAERIGAPVVFAADGTFVKTRDLRTGDKLTIDDEPLTELVSEEKLIRFIDEGSNITEEVEEVSHTREELIQIFEWSNDLLRKEGLRTLDRFVEFSNLLFIKLFSEIEEQRAEQGKQRRIDKELLWDGFSEIDDPNHLLRYINDTVLKDGFANKYNHSDDIFRERLKIRNPETVKLIVQKLDDLQLLNTESEVKGDAFEYFLKTLASGNDLGEYFTPRHIVDVMVKITRPKYGEKIFDPFCGTGGFLIEAFRRIKKGVDEDDEEIMETLRKDSLYGVELTDTYKIAKMNMILAGDGHNNIVQADSARDRYWDKFREAHDSQEGVQRINEHEENGFDLILTNVPYGQDTDHGKDYPVPSNKGDSIFLQHIIQRLRDGGRAAVIVPEGLLFRDEHQPVRQYLLDNCDMYAIISLPSGVFLPYTNAKADILVFEKGTPTKVVWYYKVEHDGRELSTNRRPIDENDIPDLLEKWDTKPEANNCFYVDRETIDDNDHVLSLNAYIGQSQQGTEHETKPLEDVCISIRSGGTPRRSNQDYWDGDIPWVKIGDMDKKYLSEEDIEERITQEGLDESSTKLFPAGTVLISIFGTIGETAILDTEAATNQAVAGLITDSEVMDTEFLYYVLKAQKEGIKGKGRGVAQDNINLTILREIEVPVPPLTEQQRIVNKLRRHSDVKDNASETLHSMEEAGIDESFFSAVETVKLSDVATINPKFELTNRSKEHYVEMAAVDKRTGDINYFKKRDGVPSSLSRFKENDILFAKISPCTENGKIALAEGLHGQTGVGSGELVVIHPEDVDPRWLFLYLRTPKVREMAADTMRGTTGRQRIPLDFFRELEIPKMSMQEQHAVVEVLDSYRETKRHLADVMDLSEDAIMNTISGLYTDEH